ncbi:DNA replication and repair protein RecF [Candidatus Saccharibacteria bacterium]|nr:DNA replication and repair protein RecF [Candidatus Saccharibacteria bacterium]
MIIKSVKLINFRNHSSYVLQCEEKTTQILGKNGFGKTSILEAIYILMQGKSFRATDKEILKRGTDYYRIELEYCSGERSTATYDGTTKNFIINDQKTKRIPKKNKYPVVLFLPSDLHLISSSPSRRRDYFDRIISELDESYHQSLLKYDKALKQRNELLKNEFVSKEAVFSWDLLLAKYGTKIHNLRLKYVDTINNELTKVYYSITKIHDEVTIDYKSDLDLTNEENYIKELTNSFQKDKILGYTSFGIHRDDYVFYFNHEIADGSASRGESRSIILALKFIEAKLIKDQLNQKPVILLDDVFSELDEIHRKSLVKNFKNNQIIITSV